MSENNPKLTIIVPTKNRSHILKISLQRIIRSVYFAKLEKGKVEILIVNNFSNDGTEELVKNFMTKHDFIKYYHHKVPYPCAEESLLNSFDKCRGDYIWTFGDDDYMNVSAILKVFNLIKNDHYGLLIMNTKHLIQRERKFFKNFITFEDDSIDYIEYVNTSELFKEFGFLHICAGLPLICFKRKNFDYEFFKNAVNESYIYSFSFSLMASFYKEKSLFIAKPLVIMTQNKSSDEFDRMSKIAIQNNLLPRFFWSSGVLKLTFLLSKKTKLDIEVLLTFREIIFDRTYYRQFEMYLIQYVLAFFIEDLKNLKTFDLIKRKKIINKEIETFLKLLDNDIFKSFGLNYIFLDFKKIIKYSKNIFYFTFRVIKIKRIIKNMNIEKMNHNIKKFYLIPPFEENNTIKLIDKLDLFYGKIKK